MIDSNGNASLGATDKVLFDDIFAEMVVVLCRGKTSSGEVDSLGAVVAKCSDLLERKPRVRTFADGYVDADMSQNALCCDVCVCRMPAFRRPRSAS